MSQSRKSKIEGVSTDKVDDNLTRQQDAVQNQENEFFNKHYNKELRVSKDEIPIVLAELNESAFAFIKKEQFERALNLLQKAYGIMDAIDFQACRRDMYHLFIMFHNMALCYQKMQMLEECAQCIEHAFDHLPITLINLEEKSISYRMRKIFILGKLKLQYCAILSQIHRHKDALEQAREGVKVCHHMVNDMHQLCQFYVKREKLNNAYIDVNKLQSNNDSQNNSNQQALEDYSSRFDNKRSYGSQSRNRSFTSFLSQQEAYTGFESFSLNNVKNQSFIGGNTGSNKSLAGGGRQASVGQNVGNLTRGSGNQSMHSLSSFCTVNELEKSISYVERTAKKLLPILIEVKKRMIPDKKQGADGRGAVKKGGKKGDSNLENSDQDEDEDLIVDLSKIKGNQKMRDRRGGPAYDMKNILGYLNQGENLQTLSIGNIMQLQAFRLKDMIEEGKNELELTRESFIHKISHLAVSYFCYSTEIRFILQMKEDPTFESAEKQRESEYWHAKSLQIACSFLPGECPLLNHINMSFQKHFAPVKTEIKEDEETDDKLRVVKPLHGIENQKFQPMIKNLDDVDISITPYQMTPLNAVTRPFIHQLKSFNSYAEKSQNNSFANNQNSSSHQTHKAGGSSGALGSKGRNQKTLNEKGNNIEETIVEGMSEDGLADSSREGAAGGANASRSQYESDLQLLENLFKKVQVNYNVDKVKLFKKLIDSNAEKSESKQQDASQGRPNKNILQVLNSNKTAGGGGSSTSKHDEISIDQAVDFLMDENILTNESREEDDGGQIIRTPNNIKNLNVKGINQINSGSFNNQTGMKKAKGGSGKAVSSSKGGHSGSQTQAHVKSSLGQQPLVGPSHSSGQGGSQSMHQRPKTQINGQRNSSNRDSRTQQSTFGPNGSITSIDHASGKSGSAVQQSQKSAASQQNMLGSNMQRYHQHERNSGNQQQSQKLAQQHQAIDAKAKRSAQRPFSGGIQKMIKSDNHKSRLQNFNQKNFSMYEQKMANVGPVPSHAPGSQQAQQTQNSKFLNPGVPAHVQSHSPTKVSNSGGSRGLQAVSSQGGPSRFENQGEHHQLYYNNNQHHQSQQQLSKHPPQSFSQSSSIGASGRNSQPTAAELAANPLNSQNHQKQLQILQKQHQQLAAAMAIGGQGAGNGSGSGASGQGASGGGSSAVYMKNQLQGAASNILASNGGNSTGTGGGAPSSSTQNGDQSQAQYEDLKKKLLTEYKKMQKKGGGAVSQNQLQQLKQAQQSTHQPSNAQLQSFLNPKSQQQIEQTLQSSAKALSQSHQQLNETNNTQNSGSLNANNNLNNSTTSAHLNVYKPTFIINNSYQPGGQGAGASGGAQASSGAPDGDRNHSRNAEHLNSHTSSFNNGQSTTGQINNPQNLAISAAGPSGGSVRERNSGQGTQHATSSSQHAQMQKSSHNMHSSFGKKQSSQMRGVLPGGGQHLQIQSHPGQQKVQKNTSITPSQQQILLMNMLLSQGMDKAQAQAQVQAQMQQMQGNGSKSHKDASRSSNLSAMQLQQHAQQPSNLKKSNRYQSSSNGRGITPTQESKSPHLITQHHNMQGHQQLHGSSSSGQQMAYLGQYNNQSRNAGGNGLLDGSGGAHSRSVNQASTSGQVKSQSSQPFAQYHASSQSQLSKSGLQGSSQGASYHQGVSATLSAANLPQSSNIVTGGKISSAAGGHGSGGGSRGYQGQQNITMPPGRKK